MPEADDTTADVAREDGRPSTAIADRLRATDEQVTIGLKHAAADEIDRLRVEADGSCRKCGSGDISVTHHEGGQYRSVYRCQASRDQETSWPDEHLCFTCRRCSFKWTGPTADSGRSGEWV